MIYGSSIHQDHWELAADYISSFNLQIRQVPILNRFVENSGNAPHRYFQCIASLKGSNHLSIDLVFNSTTGLVYNLKRVFEQFSLPNFPHLALTQSHRASFLAQIKHSL
ncbi:hypothetical protein L596_005375 [Steinernema carpocapsae]|uniref:Uncharacterized protein n=1 Tax=Steinernema carpocapsae TaxID=34508 RepID=A0A4U8UZZ3_STECR|nr:hypothetical protein L596_005375 [Steinernema carpocapsae]